MCGIAGLARWDGRPPAVDEVQAMCDAIVHRGPDDQGIYADDRVAIGMRRLSIIDLSTGHQPVRNEDGTVWVVFNGEIYNFKELREELRGRGHRFYTTSDTETIVHLYEDYGAACVEHLRGMFTFALWDTRKRQLLIARDRLGIKPLYYTTFNGGLAFASELKSLLEVSETGRDLNWQAVNHLFTFRATSTTESIIDGVHKLRPGHTATLSEDGRLEVKRYWDVRFEPNRAIKEDDLVDRLRALLSESVDLHMRSDVPFGVFLSGGLDSSAVLATMAGLRSEPIKTFSIGFKEDEFSELVHARQVAKAFKTEHHELVLEPHNLDIVDELAWYLDEPFGDSSSIPTYMVSKLAAEHVKVVLTGDGGDEVFGGYDKYVVQAREQALDRVPAPLRRLGGVVGRSLPEGTMGRNFLQHLALDGAQRYVDASVMFRRAERMKLFRSDIRAELAKSDPIAGAIKHLTSGNGQGVSALQYWDLQCYLPLDILTKVDRMTMAHSIEARPALLDHRLVEFAATVPPELALNGLTTKYLFKRAMRGVLPDSIIDRKKQGFAVPLSKWFRGNWSGFLRETLLSQRARERSIFDTGYVEQLIKIHEGGRNLDHQLWLLMSFELWARTFMDGDTGRARRRRATERFVTPRTPELAHAR